MIEAPGKVVLHVRSSLQVLHVLISDHEQWSAVCYSHDGDKFEYDSLSIFDIIEEEGVLKVVRYRDFSDPQKRDNLHSWVAKSLAKRAT